MCLYICQWRIQHRAYPAYAPPPLISENIAFSCIFLNKVKLTIFFQPKCGLRPILLHILDPPLYVATIPTVGGLHGACLESQRSQISVGSLHDREITCLAADQQGSISNHVSCGQCHLIHITIPRRFFWPS